MCVRPAIQHDVNGVNVSCPVPVEGDGLVEEDGVGVAAGGVVVRAAWVQHGDGGRRVVDVDVAPLITRLVVNHTARATHTNTHRNHMVLFG